MTDTVAAPPELTAPDKIQIRMYPSTHQRTLDLVVVFLLAPLWLPLFALVGLIVLISSSGPAMFGQVRVGFMGKKFTVLKFRTMVTDSQARLQDILGADPSLRAEWETYHKLHKDPRITPFGRFLRKTSLDELPQILNVLRGEMALVGPRPLPEYHLIEAPIRFREARMMVKPGLTGVWQIHGRDGRIEKLIKHDTDYLSTRSWMQDLRILLQTAWVVLTGKGAV